MDLWNRWKGVGSSNSSSNSRNGVKPGGVNSINHADYKQFGLENFGNTCYANAVLQALYFCQPFRELVCDAHDKSNPPAPPSLLRPPPPTPISPPSARSPALKGPFRRRESNLDGSKPPDDSLANGSPSLGIIPISTTPPTLFSALRSLFLHIALNPSDKGTVSPSTFIKKLKEENELYRSSMHQDAHEFLNFLLNKIVEDLEADMKRAPELVEDLSNSLGSLPAFTNSSSSTGSASQSNSASSDSQSNRNRNPQMTFVHSLFEGTLTSETRCLTCETVSSRDESFLDLSIDIEQNSSVTACLRQFSASEMLSQKNKFFCDSCGGLQEAEKRMKIKKLPNVLALHLKRFKYQEDVQKYIKLAYRVAFPFELRLFNTIDDADDPDRLFQLFAIVVHIGGGPHHGHYKAIVKAHGTWLVFDDDTVESIREIDICKYFGESPNGAGYVLFYQAVDLDLASIGIEPTPAFTSEGEVGADTEAESSADSDPIVSAFSPQPMTSPDLVKPDVPNIIEPPALNAVGSNTLGPSTVGGGSSNGGFLSNLAFGRTLKHSQSVKVITDKKRAAAPAAFDMDPPPVPVPLLRTATTTNGTIPLVPTPTSSSLPPLVHSKSLKGKDRDKDGGSSIWGNALKKEKREKRLRPPVPPGLVVDVGESKVSSHDERRPSAPGFLEHRHILSERGSATNGLESPARRLQSESTLPTSSPLRVSPLSPPPASFSQMSDSPPMPRSPTRTSRPSTSPSSFPPSSIELPPIPPPPIPSLTQPRLRKLSQTSPPPPPPPQAFPAVEQPSAVPPAPRPPSAGAKPKRKLSLSPMPLFTRNKEKDKEKERETGIAGRLRSATTATVMPPEPIQYTSRNGAI